MVSSTNLVQIKHKAHNKRKASYFEILLWLKIQRDSKRLTHFVSLYGLNSKRRLNTCQTVGCSIPSSLLALRVELRGLSSKLFWIRLTFSSDTRGRPELLPLHRQPYLLKLVIPTTNALPRWRLIVEKKTKRTLYSSRRFSFNELTNAKKILLCMVDILLPNWRCCTAVR